MTRRRFPLVDVVIGVPTTGLRLGEPALLAHGTVLNLFSDEACTVPLDATDLEGGPISSVIVDGITIPGFYGPDDGTALVYAKPVDGPGFPVWTSDVADLAYDAGREGAASAHRYLVTDHGVTGEDPETDTDNLERLLTITIPDFVDDWGPANNFDVSGVAVVEFPPDLVVTLTRQIVIPSTKAFTLWCPTAGGARIVYQGAETRSDGTVTAGDKTFPGSGFTLDDEGAEIVIYGADAAGHDFVTWVQSFTSAGEVELAHAPVTPVAGATYVLRPSAFRKGGVRSDPRGIPYGFVGLTFQGGGVCFNNGTKPVRVSWCTFHQTPAPAIMALNKDNTIGNDANEGTGSVTIHGDHNTFNHCRGSYWHRAATAGLSSMTHSRTNASKARSFVLGSGFHALYQCDFQGMWDAISGFTPHLQFPSDVDVGGRSDLATVRFGSEKFSEGGATFKASYSPVLVGPADGPVVTDGSTRPEEIRFHGQCWFGGTSNPAGPSTTEAYAAVTLNKAVEGMSFAETKFAKHFGPLIREAYLEAEPTGDDTARQGITGRCWFDPSNTISTEHTAGIFSHGGADWRPQPITQTLAVAAGETRRRQNLLPRSNRLDIGTWDKSLATVAKNVVGPDGEANSGHTITRTGQGFSKVERTILPGANGFTPGEPLTLSIGGKQGTLSSSAPAGPGDVPRAQPVWDHVMAMQVLAEDIDGTGQTQHLAPYLRPITLSDRWERYVVVCPFVPNAASIKVAVFHYVGNTNPGYLIPDDPTSGLDPSDPGGPADGSILVAEFQLEAGLAASPYMDTPQEAVRGPFPARTLWVGSAVIVPGSAPPTTGRWELGDEVRNVSAVIGSPQRWICTSAGTGSTTSGGTAIWTPVGTLGFQTATTLQFQTASDPINTVNKFEGKVVRHATLFRPVVARGPNPTDPWDTTTGTTTWTPA